MNKFLIITTINEPTEAVRKYADLADWQLIIVGDEKSPKKYDLEGVHYLNLSTQEELSYTYLKTCPKNHYVRKNIGYLYAIERGADLIAETDDDNIPKTDWANGIDFYQDDLKVVDGGKYFNVYKEFTNAFVWPRGYPLRSINLDTCAESKRERTEVGVFQFLADDEPDVDAIYRLTINEPILFDNADKLLGLAPGVYCPFNSQNTFWNKKIFQYMYLPRTVTFRFTDILRGYIVQRLLWEDNMLLAFGGATVRQERNYHNLMQDFVDELPMYTQTENLIQEMDEMKLHGRPADKMQSIYAMLADRKIVGDDEMESLDQWLEDINRVSLLN